MTVIKGKTQITKSLSIRWPAASVSLPPCTEQLPAWCWGGTAQVRTTGLSTAHGCQEISVMIILFSALCHQSCLSPHWSYRSCTKNATMTMTFSFILRLASRCSFVKCFDCLFVFAGRNRGAQYTKMHGLYARWQASKLLNLYWWVDNSVGCLTGVVRNWIGHTIREGKWAKVLEESVCWVPSHCSNEVLSFI
jgi:hypothetical protein